MRTTRVRLSPNTFTVVMRDCACGVKKFSVLFSVNGNVFGTHTHTHGAVVEFSFQIQCEIRRIYIQSNNLKQTGPFIHTSNFIYKKFKKNKQKNCGGEWLKKSVTGHTEIQHKLFTLLICSDHVKLFLLFGHNMNCLRHVLINTSLCSVNWMCFLFNVFVCCFIYVFFLTVKMESYL